MTTNTDGRPVIVGVDGSDGAVAAVRWAARHAREIDAPLRLVHAVTMPGTTSMVLPMPAGIASPGLHWPQRSSDRILASAAAEAALYGPDVLVDGRTAPGAAPSVLVDAGADAALLVLGSPPRGRLAAALFGSVAGRVAAEAPCPVVVVRGELRASGPVVVAVDVAEECAPALRFAFGEAARRRCTLFAVHACRPPLMPVGTGATAVAAADALPTGEDARTARRVLTSALAPWRAAFPDVPVRERLLGGHPETAVPPETAGAALTVVGSRGRRPLAGLLLGSTSQALLTASQSPVAVVGVRQSGRTDTTRGTEPTPS